MPGILDAYFFFDFRNHNLVVDSPDVMSLTNSIVGALECLQRQQDSLAESHEEQMNMFNQLSREKNSREILELVDIS